MSDPNDFDIEAYWMTFTANRDFKIIEAVSKQIATLDYGMAFQVGNDSAFALAERLTGLASPGFARCFFTNSGSDAADTDLKIALAYPHSRQCRGA